MYKWRTTIEFCCEHGDESLPSLKDLRSDAPDVRKDVILDYLRTNYAFASPGVVRDALDSDSVIGDGSMYADDLYCWPDYLPTYVEKYNIRIPDDFRHHILENYESRKQKHSLLARIDRVVIRNNPYLGFLYEVSISRKGLVEYQSNTDQSGKAVLMVRPEDAAWIINPVMTDLFCYDDEQGHGAAGIDGYHWEICFYLGEELKKRVEGWPGENPWRHTEFGAIIRFVERCVPKDLGSQYMPEEPGSVE